MNPQTVQIHYADDETGPAEVLSGRVARIISTPMLDLELCRNSIVLLDRAPDNGTGQPRIAEILYNPHPCRCDVEIEQLEVAWLLMDVLRMLGADPQLVYPPREGTRGVLLVSHPEHIDVHLLMEAIGMGQLDEEDAEDGAPEAENE